MATDLSFLSSPECHPVAHRTPVMPDLTLVPIADLIGELHRRQAVLERELSALIDWRGPQKISQACSDCGRITTAKVADSFGLRAADLMGRARTPKVARARMVAMAGMHQAGFSLTEIGAFFDRDHTTVLHALKTLTRSSSV